LVLPAYELEALGRERATQVELGVVERPTDLLERQPERAADEDLLQPQKILLLVQPIPRARALRRHEQAQRVIMMQRPHGDARERGDFLDAIATCDGHAPSLQPHVA